MDRRPRGLAFADRRLMGKVVSVVGARPQFVKASVVCRALKARGIDQLVIHTGQHYDREMSEMFFTELGVPTPAHHLGVGSGSHGKQTATMLERLEPLLVDLPHATILVYGDTNSTLAAALVAAKLRLRLAHAEAGLRSFNRAMPEEVNRVVVDHLSDILFAPTDTAVANLEREGLRGESVHLSGDVMFDAALAFGPISEQRSKILNVLGLHPGQYILATIHRAENTNDPKRLDVIMEGLRLVAAEIKVVLPLHPRTRAALPDDIVNTRGLTVIKPVGYLDMLALERHAALIATDSGGVQKEAFFCKVPCVTLRHETEWVELVDLGWNQLAPPSSAEAVKMAILAALGSTGLEGEPYGTGDASAVIAMVLGRGMTPQQDQIGKVL